MDASRAAGHHLERQAGDEVAGPQELSVRALRDAVEQDAVPQAHNLRPLPSQTPHPNRTRPHAIPSQPSISIRACLLSASSVQPDKALRAFQREGGTART